MVRDIGQLEQQEPAVFSYPKSDILLEAEKRSSYFGKMRADKEHEDFIDRMSLTDGESFLSDEMLDDAIEQTYEWLQAFGRDVEEPYGITTDGNVQFTLQPRTWWDRNAFTRVERYIKEALVNYILWKWFEYVNPQEAQPFFDKFEDYAHKAQLGMNAENGTLERRFNTPFNTMFG